MKKLTALILALFLCMNVALAWSCPTCGSSMEGKFCAECGTKKPANICPNCGMDFGDQAYAFCTECGTKLGQSTIAPTSVPQENKDLGVIMNQQSDGRLSLVWNGDNMTEYTVTYFPKYHDTAEEDLAAATALDLYTTKTTASVCSFSRLVPGQEYWVGVFDAQGNGKYELYAPAKPVENFTTFETSVQTTEIAKVNGTATYPAAFDADALLSGGEGVHGLYVVLLYNNPGEALKDAVIQMVIDTPAGYRYMAVASKATIAANKDDGLGWSFYDFYTDATLLAQRLGALPLGDYQVSLYVNGQLAGNASFQVEKAAPATAAPTAAPTAQDVRAVISDIVANGDGSVTVSWTGGIAPYKVQYTLKRSDDFLADREAAYADGAYWNGAENAQDTSVILKRLIPGETYWIVVLDANDKGQRREYTSETSAFTTFPVTMELTPRQRIGDSISNISLLPIDTAGLDDSVEHGLFLQLNHNNPGEECELLMQLALTFPDGFKYVYGANNISFASGDGCWRKWEFYSIDAMFAYLRKYQAELQTGDLRVDVYLNGQLACSGTVPMEHMPAADPLTITSLTPMGDGSYLLAWEDNGHGPYTVYYHKHFTNDAEADRSDARNLGRWINAEDISSTSLRMEHLLPGTSYWITLEDSIGTTTTYTYTTDAAPSADLNLTVEANLQHEVDGTYEGLMFFSSAALSQEYTGSYGLYLDLEYNKLSADTSKQSQWVLTLPDGLSFCEYALNLSFYASGNAYWDHYALDWAFQTIRNYYDGVPQGEYHFDLYVEGMYAGGTTFTVID